MENSKEEAEQDISETAHPKLSEGQTPETSSRRRGVGGESGDRASRRKASSMPVRDIERDPPVRRDILFDEAYRLAMMPRQKRDDFAQTAFWSAVVTATSGLAGLYDILLKEPAQPKALDILEILIFGICVALWIVGIRNRGNIETAEEYLNKLYQVQQAIVEPGNRVARAWRLLCRG
jgi:hypothetical protein